MAEFSIKFNKNLNQLPVYVPGKSIEEVARTLNMKSSKFVKLASNENSFGPSKKAILSMKGAIKKAHIYPDGNYFSLKTTISKKFGVGNENIALGNGSNELIELIGHTLLEEGDEVIVSQYCFAIYPIVAKLFGATPVVVPAKEYGHDLQAMLNAITDKTKLVFIANPNNPTGTLASKNEVEAFLAGVPKNVMVVMDEAYTEYLSAPIDLVKKIQTNEMPNLCILRTFSKMYALAGLRVGFAIAHPEFISALEKVRAPFNINVVAESAAIAALSDEARVKKIRGLNLKGIKFLESNFKKMNLEYVPSKTNFVLVKVGDGAKVFSSLQKEGVIVRPVANYSLPNWIRVTSGTPNENKKFIKALKKVLESN
ncbi:MAG: histidinol-phosphate transaminase [archaeon]